MAEINIQPVKSDALNKVHPFTQKNTPSKVERVSEGISEEVCDKTEGFAKTIKTIKAVFQIVAAAGAAVLRPAVSFIDNTVTVLEGFGIFGTVAKWCIKKEREAMTKTWLLIVGKIGQLIQQTLMFVKFLSESTLVNLGIIGAATMGKITIFGFLGNFFYGFHAATTGIQTSIDQYGNTKKLKKSNEKLENWNKLQIAAPKENAADYNAAFREYHQMKCKENNENKKSLDKLGLNCSKIHDHIELVVKSSADATFPEFMQDDPATPENEKLRQIVKSVSEEIQTAKKENRQFNTEQLLANNEAYKAIQTEKQGLEAERQKWHQYSTATDDEIQKLTDEEKKPLADIQSIRKKYAEKLKSDEAAEFKARVNQFKSMRLDIENNTDDRKTTTFAEGPIKNDKLIKSDGKKIEKIIKEVRKDHQKALQKNQQVKITEVLQKNKKYKKLVEDVSKVDLKLKKWDLYSTATYETLGKLQTAKAHKYNHQTHDFKVERKRNWVSIAADIFKVALVTVATALVLAGIIAQPLCLIVVASLALCMNVSGLGKSLYKRYGPQFVKQDGTGKEKIEGYKKIFDIEKPKLVIPALV